MTWEGLQIRGVGLCFLGYWHGEVFFGVLAWGGSFFFGVLAGIFADPLQVIINERSLSKIHLLYENSAAIDLGRGD